MKTKKLILITALSLFTFSLAAQNANQVFKELKRSDAFYGFTVPGFLIHMGSWFVDNDTDPELKALLKRINGVRVAFREDYNSCEVNDYTYLNEVGNRLNASVYEELMTVNDGEDNIEIRINEDDGRVKELVLFGHSDEDAFYLLVKGDFHMSEIGTLMSELEDRDYY